MHIPGDHPDDDVVRCCLHGCVHRTGISSCLDACFPARYPSCVATLSRRAKDVIEAAFQKSVDGGHDNPLIGSRLHDFGFRGCTCVEQSVIGGCAHLLNFDGSDTMSAGYYAQFMLNNGRPVAQSIPASEHRCVALRAQPTE